MGSSRSVSREPSRSRSRSDRRRSRSRSYRRRSPVKGQIFITRFPSRTRSRSLERLFRPFGRIRDLKMKRNYAFITFSDPYDAKDAVRKMNKKHFKGSTMIVQHAGEKKREVIDKRRGPGDNDVCYNCQEKGHWANQCRNERKERPDRRRSDKRRRSRSSSKSSSGSSSRSSSRSSGSSRSSSRSSKSSRSSHSSRSSRSSVEKKS